MPSDKPLLAYDTGMQQQDASGVGYGHGYATNEGAPPEYQQTGRAADVAGSRGGIGNLTKNPQSDMGPVDMPAYAGTSVPPSGLRGLHYGTDAVTGYAGPGAVPGAGASTGFEHDAQYQQAHSGDPKARKPGAGRGAKPSTGQRIVGEIEKFAGKIMEDPEMVALGKQRTVRTSSLG